MKPILFLLLLTSFNSLQAQNMMAHGGIIRGDSSKKELALIFTADEFADGAPCITTTLTESGIKASFFFTGNFYRRYPLTVSALREQGHYLGSHSDKHLLYCDWKKRDSLLVTKQEFLHDLETSYKAMHDLEIHRPAARYFLPPFEWYNDSISKWTKDTGLILINFTAGTGSNADYTYPGMANYRSSADILASILAYERKQGLNGFLLLLHFGTDPRRTDKMYHLLPQLIDILKRKGYKFVRVDELLNI